MQRASVTRKKDYQIVMRARTGLGFAYALDKHGLVHTKCGARSLCGAAASTGRYSDMRAGRLVRKRGRACKVCREMARQKLERSGRIKDETKNYWMKPEWAGSQTECNFGLFSQEGQNGEGNH